MIRYLFISLFFIVACSAQNKSQKVMKGNIEMLFGKTSEKQLFFDYPAWEKLKTQYKPNKAVEDSLQAYKKPTRVLVFFGTWCGDSRRNVPRFLKSIEKNKNIKLDFYAVDRELNPGSDLAEKYNIKRVPTFIVMQNGAETGRIVEHPIRSVEQDLLDILNK